MSEAKFQVGDVVRLTDADVRKKAPQDDCVVDSGPFVVIETRDQYAFVLQSITTEENLGSRRLVCFTKDEFATAVWKRRHGTTKR